MLNTHTQPSPPPQPSQPSQPWQATKALAKASLSLLNPKLWLLSVLPLLLSALLWTGLALLGWDAANDWVRSAIHGIYVPPWMADWLPDLLPSRSVIAPFLVLLLTLPLVLITAMVGVGIFGTGLIARRVAAQYGLQPLSQGTFKKSTQLISSIWHSTWVLLVLATVWLLTLPVWLLAGAGMLVALLLLGWANSRLFSRDVLAEFATAEQRAQLLKQHRSTLWGLGLLSSVPTAIPTLMWISGALAFVFLPVMALAAVWLSIMVFLATASLFSHYLLPALKQLQDDDAAQAALQAAAALQTQHTLDQQAIETTVKEVPLIATDSTVLLSNKGSAEGAVNQ